VSILTPQQAADMLRLPNPDDYPQLNILLPGVDDFIKSATGRDWSQDNPLDPTAMLVASVLVVRWFDDIGMIGTPLNPNDPLVAVIAQLHAKALEMEPPSPCPSPPIWEV
jgi:hypothetical protein